MPKTKTVSEIQNAQTSAPKMSMLEEACQRILLEVLGEEGVERLQVCTVYDMLVEALKEKVAHVRPSKQLINAVVDSMENEDESEDESEDGSEEDGSEEDGSEEDGSEEDGSEEDGSEKSKEEETEGEDDQSMLKQIVSELCEQSGQEAVSFSYIVKEKKFDDETAKLVNTLLKQGVAEGWIGKSGQKRGTVYFVP